MAKLGGRRTKYNPETVAKIVEALEKGVTIADACEYAGISEATYYLWASSKQEFSEITQKAISKATLRLVDIINDAAPQTWQAAAWLLERRLPERWGRKVVENKLSGTVTLDWKQAVLEAMQVAHADDDESG